MTLKTKYLKVNYFSILLGISLITISIGNQSTICNSKLNCADCIQIPSCTWCAQENFSVELRCFEIGRHLCPENFAIYPSSELMLLKSDELSRKKMKNKELKENKNLKVIQMKPQHVSLKLRPNEVYNLNFKFLQAEEYPLDLYYLMDLSNSMMQHKDKLSNLGNKLASEMENITNNFKLGFGSFIDKVVSPFTETTPEALKNPCLSVNKTCASAYSYKNHMSLSTNTSQFALKVKEAEVSNFANNDIPEGGFDAIIQSIVCRGQIGWREVARRLIVFSTDASFHYAGDGKLAGIILPNDGQCHMENNQYTHAEIFDYPSVDHLNKILNTNSVNMIFAVTKDVEKTYEELSDVISSASIGIIDNDSSNILELIRQQYNKITSNIEIKDDAPQPVNIKYFTTCLNENEIESNKCYNLKYDSLIEFRAQISFTKCPTEKKYWKQTFYIHPVGINERITVDLEMICDCDCKNFDHLSKKCNEHGTYECGICKCNEGYFGKQCECQGKYVDLEDSLKGCRHNNSTCSGSGDCICGMCQCNVRENSNEIYYGKYCECDNFSCPRSNNLICSGQGHGICECGQCVCHIGWTGSACDVQL